MEQIGLRSDLSTARYQLNSGQSGSSSSGVVFGGKPTYNPPTAVTGSTEEWNAPSTTTKTISTD